MNVRPAATRATRDFYPTPAPATRALCAVEHFDGEIWECCAGRGDMAEALRAAGHRVTATDIADGDDVLQMDLRALNVVTNPPYGHNGTEPDRKATEKIAVHLLRQNPLKLALLLPFQWYCATGRARGLFADYPVSRVWAFADRFAMWPDGVAESAAMPNSNFAWFVWDRNDPGPTMLGHVFFADHQEAKHYAPTREPISN